LVERLKSDRLQRHGTDASPRLGGLDLAAHELAAYVNGLAAVVDVSPLERHELRRPQPGRGSEDDHRSCDGPELRRDGMNLVPGLEWPLLGEPPERVRNSPPGWVDVEQLPSDSGV
jgi:hypothetical protein